MVKKKVDSKEHEISANRLNKLIEEHKAIVVDVRSEDEFDRAHIKGSFNVRLDKLEEHRALFKKLHKDIFFVCKTGSRSSKACHLIDGVCDWKSASLKGGIMDWQEQGFEIVYGNSDKWSIERQVRFTAGFLVTVGALLGWLVNPLFYWISGGVGFGLMFAAYTNTCMMGELLMKLPYNRPQHYVDYERVISEILE